VLILGTSLRPYSKVFDRFSLNLVYIYWIAYVSTLHLYYCRMENDRSLMETYRYNVQTRVYELGPCDDKCAANQLCNLRYSDDARLRQCYQSV
jgi:hypothetical protein